MMNNIKEDNIIKDLNNSLTLKKNEFITKISDDDEKKILSLLKNLYFGLSGTEVNIDNIQFLLDTLQKYNDKTKKSYLNALLYPEISKGCKMPSILSIPSCAFQLHNSVTLSTNLSGKLAFLFNPFFLYNTSAITAYKVIGETPETTTSTPEFLSSFYLCNDSTLTGLSENASFIGFNVGQSLPGVYKSFRVVSASVVMKYMGRLDTSSGIMGGAIFYDNYSIAGGYASVTDQSLHHTYIRDAFNTSKYGNFDIANDAYYNKQVNVLDGIREIYFPIDNSYEEFSDVVTENDICIYKVQDGVYKIKSDTMKNKNFIFYGYLDGAPVSSSCIKVDIYVNYECLPDSAFLNYMPVNTCSDMISLDEKRMAIVTAQKMPITKNHDDNNVVNIDKVPNVFDKMKRKYGNVIPNIIDVIT